MGWAVIEGGKGQQATWIASGIAGLDRERADNEKYQPYRLRLIEYWALASGPFLDTYTPDFVANEIIPPATGRAFKSNGVQGQLAATAITALHTMAAARNIQIKQFGATSIKKAIAGDSEATKVGVRNGVYALIPELKDMKHHLWTKKEWMDESDACATALVALGYKA